MSKFDKAPLPYENLTQKMEIVKKRLGRDMTLSEKVLYSHLDDPKGQVRKLNQSYCNIIYLFCNNILLMK